jgi:hypothetical protein
MPDEFDLRVRTARIQAEDERQFEQMVRKMKVDAFKIEGGAIVALGPEAYPFFWVEPAGQAAVEQLYQFHIRPDGSEYTDIAVKSVWDFTFGRPQSGLIGPEAASPVDVAKPLPASELSALPYLLNESLARLSVKYYREDGQQARLNVWFELGYHHTVLRSVHQTRRLMIYSRKPDPRHLEATPAVVIAFETTLPELKEALRNTASTSTSTNAVKRTK